MPEQKIGRVTHWFGHINVAAIELTEGELAVGDTIHVRGHTTDHTQKVDSMQIEKQTIQTASRGQSVGIKLSTHARPHDEVFKVVPD
jgi:translation initiation factor IF-2